jgi:hypothetical protein
MIRCARRKPQSPQLARQTGLGVSLRASAVNSYAERTQFRPCRAGRGRSGLERGTNVQNEANLGRSLKWEVPSVKLESLGRTKPIPAEPGTSGPADTGRETLYKQTQFASVQREGQVLSGRRFMVNSTWNRLRRNKANSGGARCVGACQRDRGTLYKQTQSAPDGQGRPWPRACPERSEWAPGLDAATRQAPTAQNEPNFPVGGRGAIGSLGPADDASPLLRGAIAPNKPNLPQTNGEDHRQGQRP